MRPGRLPTCMAWRPRVRTDGFVACRRRPWEWLEELPATRPAGGLAHRGSCSSRGLCSPLGSTQGHHPRGDRKSECQQRIPRPPARKRRTPGDRDRHRPAQVHPHRDSGRLRFQQGPRLDTDQRILRRLRPADDLVQAVARPHLGGRERLRSRSSPTQWLIGRGEAVVDEPSTATARVRELSRGGRRKNDRIDAAAAACVAFSQGDFRPVAPEGHTDVLRILDERRIDLVKHNGRLINQLHAILRELLPGGVERDYLRQLGATRGQLGPDPGGEFLDLEPGPPMSPTRDASVTHWDANSDIRLNSFCRCFEMTPYGCGYDYCASVVDRTDGSTRGEHAALRVGFTDLPIRVPYGDR
ncbi:IS110 family transposase [Rhodococcus opacus]|uniref:IS110 family transposase n=1 Tax=Rhodococcus opacus TaxID=37919 RepID=UPI0039C23CC1